MIDPKLIDELDMGDLERIVRSHEAEIREILDEITSEREERKNG